MITLDPEFVGSLAPEPKLTSAVNEIVNIPYARLPRMERLRVSGKADETEADDADQEDDADGDNSRRLTKEEKIKKKMRGKNKTLKRCAPHSIRVSISNAERMIDIYANSVKMLLTLEPYVFRSALMSLEADVVSRWLYEKRFRKKRSRGKKRRLLRRGCRSPASRLR